MAITNVSDKKVKDESKSEFVIPDMSVKELLNAIPLVFLFIGEPFDFDI